MLNTYYILRGLYTSAYPPGIRSRHISCASGQAIPRSRVAACSAAELIFERASANLTGADCNANPHGPGPSRRQRTGHKRGASGQWLVLGSPRQCCAARAGYSDGLWEMISRDLLAPIRMPFCLKLLRICGAEKDVEKQHIAVVAIINVT